MTDKNPPPPRYFIRPWHVVLGDTSCRNDRTTLATKVLRDIKRESRKKYFGQKKGHWVPLAIKELQARLAALSFDGYDNHEPKDIGRVLIKCTPKALKSRRVAEPYLYGYPGDTQAWYGIAKTPMALEFFLTSRDGPQLEQELNKHQENLQAFLQKRCSCPCLKDFAETLQFFQRQVQKAEDGNELASKLLESLKPINALREQWKLVQQQCENAPTSSQTEAMKERPETPPVATENYQSEALAKTWRPSNQNNPTATGNSPVTVDAAWEVDFWNAKDASSKAFYPIDLLPPPDAASLSDKETASEGAFEALLSDVDDPLDLDRIDVDGFMADLELADESRGILAGEVSKHPHPSVADNPKRRNRSNSDAGSVSSRSQTHATKRSKTTSFQATVAAVATLATLAVVSKTAHFGRIDSRQQPPHDLEEPVGRFLQGTGLLDGDSFEPLSRRDEDDDWCSKEENNPFARLGDLGEFLCSIDFTSSFHDRSDKNKDEKLHRQRNS